MYKSSDGGKTWAHLGLREALQIGGLAVDPKNKDRVFAAVLGHPTGQIKNGVFTARQTAAKLAAGLVHRRQHRCNTSDHYPKTPILFLPTCGHHAWRLGKWRMASPAAAYISRPMVAIRGGN